MPITHTFVNPKSDGPDATITQPGDWNASHTVTGYVAETLLDAKGDIIAASAADTAAKLTVGANNTVLTADSTTGTGLKWAAAASGASYAGVWKLPGI